MRAGPLVYTGEGRGSRDPLSFYMLGDASPLEEAEERFARFGSATAAPRLQEIPRSFQQVSNRRMQVIFKVDVR